MHILVDTSHCEYLFIVSDRLTSVEFLGLFQGAFSALNLTALGIQDKAVTDPSIVASKDQDLRIIQWETSHRIPWRPVVVSIHEAHGLPSLLVELLEPIQSFNRLQWLLIHGVPPANDIQVATVKNTDRMVMSWLSQVGNLEPLVLGNLIDFALLGHLVRVLGAHGIEEVLGLILESLVQVGQLMAGPPKVHGCFPLDF